MGITDRKAPAGDFVKYCTDSSERYNRGIGTFGPFTQETPDMPKIRLFTPGPVMIPDEVLLEAAQPLEHHRTQVYQNLL